LDKPQATNIAPAAGKGYDGPMPMPRCPQCKADVERVRPVRIPSDPDSRRWTGRAPAAIGFVCPMCGVLLPVSPTNERDDA
jgi:hypothetical protein